MKRKTITGILAALLLLLLGAVLTSLAAWPVRQKAPEKSQRLDITQRYQAEMENRFDRILFGQEQVKKVYQISDTAITAPTPNPECFGQAEDPAELQWLVEAAQELLDGQKLYFSTDVELCPGSSVGYYLDETILAITWKQVIANSVFTFAEVKVAHPSQFRRYLSGGEYGSGKLELTTRMAQNVNAVAACSADYYSYRREGLTAINGTVHKYFPGERGALDICMIDRNGDMIMEPTLKLDGGVEAAQEFIDQRDTNFTLAFGPILVKDGQLQHTKYYPIGEIIYKFPRAALCQMDKLHYLYAVCNKDSARYSLLSMDVFAQCIYETGCRQAYALDGGQTATVVLNNQAVNNVNYGSERRISDIIYFATAKPAGE